MATQLKSENSGSFSKAAKTSTSTATPQASRPTGIKKKYLTGQTIRFLRFLLAFLIAILYLLAVGINRERATNACLQNKNSPTKECAKLLEKYYSDLRSGIAIDGLDTSVLGFRLPQVLSGMNFETFLYIGTGLYSGVEFILFICWGLLELKSKLSTKEFSWIMPSDTTKPLEAFSEKQDTPSYKELFPNGADVQEKTEEPELQTSYENAPQRKTEPESSSRPSAAEPTAKKRSRGRPRRGEVVPPKQNKKKKQR